jgi:hypothetical protein
MDIEMDKPGEPHWLSKDECPKCNLPLAAHSIRFGPDDKGNEHGLMYVDCPPSRGTCRCLPCEQCGGRFVCPDCKVCCRHGGPHRADCVGGSCFA